MAKIIISEDQFKNLCRNMLKEERKADYVRGIIEESYGQLVTGLKYETLDPSELDRFSDYDKSVASCHIANCGRIIVYAGTMEPIDNEYDLEEIYKEIQKSGE